MGKVTPGRQCGSPLCGREIVGRSAVAPIDAVAVARVGAGVADSADIQRVDATFGRRVVARHRCRGCDVDDEHAAAQADIGEAAVLVDHVDRDRRVRIAISIGVRQLPVGGQVGGEHCLVDTVAPVDRVLRDRVRAQVGRVQSQHIGAAFVH